LKKLQNEKKVSVVIPTYNRSHLFQRAIKSAINQTLPPHEIIVVNDGSTDDTSKMLKKYPVKVIEQKNSGVSSARNSGILNSSGDIIAFLDDDDEWEKSKLQEQLKIHNKFSHTHEVWIRDGKVLNQKAHHKKPEEECFYDNLSFCKIAPSTVLIDKNILLEVGLFDESLEVCEDFDLWLRVLKKYPIKLLKKPLTKKYAGESEQLSFKYFAMDRFRILSLLKFKEDKLVKKEILKKLNILKKGAIKHKNQDIINFVLKIQNTL